jgi:hypothetical protein
VKGERSPWRGVAAAHAIGNRRAWVRRVKM